MQRYREIGPEGRSLIAAELSEAVRRTTLDGIRARHPEYSEDEVRLAFLKLVYGIVPKR